MTYTFYLLRCMWYKNGHGISTQHTTFTDLVTRSVAERELRVARIHYLIALLIFLFLINFLYSLFGKISIILITTRQDCADNIIFFSLLSLPITVIVMDVPQMSSASGKFPDVSLTTVSECFNFYHHGNINVMLTIDV